jgi:predicted nucleic acid-binding protein
MVIDASVAVKWLVNETEAAASRTILLGDAVLLAPDLLATEVAGALVRKFREGNLTDDEVRASMGLFAALPIAFTATSELLGDAVGAALAHSHPLPDCVYIALARRRGAPLATFDRRQATLAAHLNIPLWTPA